MGTAAGLTGGYASSYAQTASQQAYDRYMQELAELMPELESSARQRDQDQRNWLTQRYEQVSEQEQADYKRYRQEQDAWQESYDRAGKEADALREQEYARLQADAAALHEQGKRRAEGFRRWPSQFRRRGKNRKENDA